MTAIFLKITNPSIDGEAISPDFRDDIVVKDYAWGMSNTSRLDGGNVTAGRATVDELTITKPVDKATPILMRHCLTGGLIRGPVTLTVRLAGDGSGQYVAVTIVLEDVLVAGVTSAASRDSDDLLEQVRFTFSEARYAYVQRRPNGTLAPEISVQHDLAANTTC